MYKIFVSAMAYDSGQSGISVYINNVLRELSKEHQLEVLAFHDDIGLMPQTENIKYLKVSVCWRRAAVNILWHLFILPWTVRWKNYDFVFLPAGNRRLLRFYRKFSITTVHDLSQYHVAQKYDFFRMFYCKKILPFYIKRVNRVVAVSGSTADDLERFWSVPASRITVNYNGFDCRKFTVKSVEPGKIQEKFAIKKKYILYVSRIEHPGKNHLNLIKAYECLPKKLQAEYELVLAGTSWFGSEEVKDYAEQSNVAENIKFTGFIKQEELAPLYQGAALYIFPSLFEGFGLSLLEAMACGVPVACSKTSSLGEVGGKAVLQFDPTAPDEIRLAMQDILENPELRESLVKHGFERLKTFDWAKHASELVKLYADGNKVTARCGIFDFCVRVMGWIFALAVCAALVVPIFCIAFLRKMFSGKDIFAIEKIYGKNESVLNVCRFNFHNVILCNASLFYHILIFELRLVGVSIRKYPELNRQPGDVDLFLDCPGIISLWFLRKSRGIAYEGRLRTELEYLNTRSLFGDMMIVLRSLPTALFYNKESVYSPDKVTLLDVEFDNICMKRVIDSFAEDIGAGRKKKAYFVNTDCFNKSVNDAAYLEILRKGDYILPDGIGVLLACKMLHIAQKENINGTDMLPFLCEMAAANGYSMFLFGARPGVAALAQQTLQKDYPSLRIAGTRNGYFNDTAEEKELIRELNLLKPDILLVALGAPLQEKWIAGHGDELACHLMIGVGGLFDFCSGRLRRAPRWMREIGLEWLFRTIMEPGKKFRRYAIGNFEFLWRVCRWKQKAGKNK